jgi:hypothetical protein
VESEADLLVCARYGELNPVRAGLCDHPLDWRWSSCRATLGLVRKPDFLYSSSILDQFGTNTDVARHRYLEFIEDGLAQSR